MRSYNFQSNRQTGSALVVGLILLVAVTLMAVSSMNTASLDLIMSGNEQFHSRAFQSAEAGIEAALKTGNAFDTSKDFTLASEVTTGVGDDTYTFGVTRPTSGVPSPPPSGTSEGTFAAYYFRIASTGTSQRGAVSVNTQELYEVVKAGTEFTCQSAWSCSL